jgi:hypothetical protein
MFPGHFQVNSTPSGKRMILQVEGETLMALSTQEAMHLGKLLVKSAKARLDGDTIGYCIRTLNGGIGPSYVYLAMDYGLSRGSLNFHWVTAQKHATVFMNKRDVKEQLSITKDAVVKSEFVRIVRLIKRHK